MAGEMIASAIALPEAIEEPIESSAATPTNNSSALKRRASELPEHEQDGKRQRLSPGKTPPIKATPPVDSEPREPEQSQEATNPGGEGEEMSRADSFSDANAVKESKAAAPRRKSSTIVEEKQRNKRLFGALLGNLNRPAAGDRTTKRRQEIEDRRKAELRRQDERDARDQQDKRSRLVEQRRKQKVNLDEHNMLIRHRYLRDTANYLKTRSEPQVYYRPWDLRPDEEDRIDDQIISAQEQIDRESSDFKSRNRQPQGDHSPDDSTPEKTDDVPAADRAAGITAEPAKSNEESQAQNGERSASVVLVSEEQPKLATDPNISIPPDTADAFTNDANTSARAGSVAVEGESTVDARVDAEEDEDHVVEGDEDTAIY